MDWLNSLGLAPELQALATGVFLVALAVFAAWSRTIGKADVAKPQVREFGFAGQLADMGPVKELVESVGLLIQQQVKTNIHLEASATNDRELVDLVAAYLADLRAERAEREADEAIEEKAQQLAEKMVKAMKPVRRRRQSVKRPGPSPDP